MSVKHCHEKCSPRHLKMKAVSTNMSVLKNGKISSIAHYRNKNERNSNFNLTLPKDFAQILVLQLLIMKSDKKKWKNISFNSYYPSHKHMRLDFFFFHLTVIECKLIISVCFHIYKVTLLERTVHNHSCGA